MNSVPNYLINDGLTSREGCRIFEGVCSTARDLGYGSFTINGVEFDIEPAQTFFKSVDSAWYIPKAVGDTEKIADSGEKLGKVYSDSNASWMDRGAATLTLTKDIFKFISDASASLKFLGTLGVAYLAPRVKVLGLAKNAFSVYCSVHAIAVDSFALKKAVGGDEDDRTKIIITKFLAILGSLTSVGLNFFGGLDSLYGSALQEAGKGRMPPFAWNVMKLGGSVSGLIRNTIDNCC